MAKLTLLSLLTGAVIGLVIGCFRLALDHMNAARTETIAWAHQWPVLGFVLVCASVAATTALAASLVQRSGQPAAGSGIPHVEAVIEGTLPAAPLLLLPVKFVGGLLAIGGGLALGREGPSVQMGANLAQFCGSTFRLPTTDRIALFASGAGAGLAVAFNAPMAGSVFVLEELVRRFDIRIAIAALGASCSAIAVASLLLGQQPDFNVAELPVPSSWTGPIFGLLGILAGLAGVAYNRLIIKTCALFDGLTRWRPEFRALLIGALVGALAWFAPDMVGGGDEISQQVLVGGIGLAALPLIFAVRFVLGPLSYAAGTPGGLFAPILALGACLGLGFGLLCPQFVADSGATPITFAIAGMAAFLTATVRAPVTGMILIFEMTGAFNQALPMLWASFAAMAVPTLMGNSPIYDSMKARTIGVAKTM
ncbi:H(+)/Cl(-) exchange transporter ClcA [Candidatus Accumulibacter sp. ACC003]|uniref:H(+)/Cl(-) exchange transporter ClcA n=1 Tax=Candidatus Accumulibacter sp. ACC003 TaxID=2823334 RepID=UPI0025C1CE23|nr:H(+)/Cl(-) exchange transporter ClcA [Candidatus Accumulibacter sp. ACC003]